MAGVGAVRPARRAAARPAVAGTAALGVALVAWVLAGRAMSGMDAGPGTDPGGLVGFVGLWTVMMAAMMLPATAPVAALHARTAPGHASLAFVAAYLAVWVAVGLAAWAIHRGLAALDPAVLRWEDGGPYVAGAAVVAAGLFQLTPLKVACLRHCRSPMAFLMTRWRPGTSGAAAMGAEHGLWCAGCCWALMVVLFAVGVMSTTWMAVVAVAILAERLLPVAAGRRAVALALVVLGLWIAVAPGSVPGLTQPGSAPMAM